MPSYEAMETMSHFSQSIPEACFHPAVLQTLSGEQVRCLVCERRCELTPGELGWCQTRLNQQGKLMTRTYGTIAWLSVNPIEQKPLYHFYPGTLTLTSGSLSCNFRCPWCQSYHIARVSSWGGRFMSPAEFVAFAVAQECQGTSVSFNEPTLSLEWALDMFTLAREQGLYNTYVTNGYMTTKALGLLEKAGLHAINVDIKGNDQIIRRYCGEIDIEKIWRNCQLAQKLGIHLELTTLIIPGITDSDEVLYGIAKRILADLGPEVPWHVTGYFPAYHFSAPPTPLDTIKRAWYIGKDAGLQFVYPGNMPSFRQINTPCPNCGAILIERQGFRMIAFDLDQGTCPHCKRKIPGVWE